jgi:hypothetical protein
MSLTVNDTAFTASIRRLSQLNGKGQAENLLAFARTTLTNRDGSGLIDITPPAGGGVRGTAAKKRGEAAIDRDLSRVFAAVKLKHEAKERHPSPGVIHQRLIKHKRPGSPLRSDRGRQKYYVDRTKLLALAKRLKSHVGRLASAWLVSANRLGVRAPAWITRHGAGAGDCTVKLSAPRYSIEMAINPRPHAPVAELHRRVGIALGYTAKRIGRAITGTLEAQARKAGFKTAA